MKIIERGWKNEKLTNKYWSRPRSKSGKKSKKEF